MALMVLDSVNNTAALRRPGHRLPKQDGRLRLGGLRFQRETTARPGLCRHDARHSREALLETIRFTQLLSRCALLCFCAEHHAKEGKINWKKKNPAQMGFTWWRLEGLYMNSNQSLGETSLTVDLTPSQRRWILTPAERSGRGSGEQRNLKPSVLSTSFTGIWPRFWHHKSSSCLFLVFGWSEMHVFVNPHQFFVLFIFFFA